MPQLNWLILTDYICRGIMTTAIKWSLVIYSLDKSSATSSQNIPVTCWHLNIWYSFDLSWHNLIISPTARCLERKDKLWNIELTPCV